MKTFKVRFADAGLEDLVIEADAVERTLGGDYEFQKKQTGLRDEFVTVAWIDADRVLFIQEQGASGESA